MNFVRVEGFMFSATPERIRSTLRLGWKNNTDSGRKRQGKTRNGSNGLGFWSPFGCLPSIVLRGIYL